MHCSEYHPTRTRLSQTLAAVVLSAGLFPPGANAQMTPPQARPQAQSPTTQAPRSQSPSPTLSDEKLNAAAAAIGQVTSIRQNYERKISKAPPSDKRRLAEEENDALQRAATDRSRGKQKAICGGRGRHQNADARRRFLSTGGRLPPQ
jgi:hypothetical protein